MMDIKELIKQMRFQKDMLGANYISSCITLKDGCQVSISIMDEQDFEEQEDDKED